MPPEVAKYLLDVRQTCDTLLKITAGKSLDDYTADVVLRLAVERAFIIIGEALNRLLGQARKPGSRAGRRKSVSSLSCLTHLRLRCPPRFPSEGN